VTCVVAALMMRCTVVLVSLNCLAMVPRLCPAAWSLSTFRGSGRWSWYWRRPLCGSARLRGYGGAISTSSGGKIKIQRGFTADGGIDKPKSRASRSRSTVEMHEALQAVFMDWRSQTIYAQDQDFIFPSYRLKGAKPRLGSMIV